MKNCDPWKKRYKNKNKGEVYVCLNLDPGDSFQIREWKFKQNQKFLMDWENIDQSSGKPR